MKVLDNVTHSEYGTGIIQSIQGLNVTVKFDTGLVHTVTVSSLSTMIFS